MILSFDCSLPALSVALTSERGTIASVALEGKDSRNEKLLPAVDWLLEQSGVAKNDLNLIATTRGPGSFTGVRVGLATAAGLSLALRIPVCAMSTHEAAAESRTAASLAVYGDAGRGEFYVSLFENDQQSQEPFLATRGRLDSVLEHCNAAVDLSELVRTMNVAVLTGRRAQKIAAAGRLESYSDATPIYVRLAEAEVKLQQRTHA